MKHSIIAAVLALITLVTLSDFDFFNTYFLMPNLLWILPLYIFFRLSTTYFHIAYKGKLSLGLKVGVMVINTVLILLLLKTGFSIWKQNVGNILMESQSDFIINVKNIWFWVMFQSYILLFFFSAFKLLVTIDQEK